ncbi:hypothetical protein [Moorena producens]|uniref:hypothetical protein n=1 Tax=Moorena producens TaxID=1155739 RepID=UPI003C717891
MSLQAFSLGGFNPLQTLPKIAVASCASEYLPTDEYLFRQPQPQAAVAGEGSNC